MAGDDEKPADETPEAPPQPQQPQTQSLYPKFMYDSRDTPEGEQEKTLPPDELRRLALPRVRTSTGFPVLRCQASERSVDPASRRAGRPDPFEAPAGSCRTPPTLARDAGSPRAATSGGRGEQSPRLPGPARFP